MKNKFIEQNKLVVFFFLLFFVVTLFLPLNWADDAVFLQKTADKTLHEFLSGSARPFTDGLTYVFARNQWLWRILNPVVLVLCIWAVSETLPEKPKKGESIFISFSIAFATMAFVDAGFIATTLNYLWPITFGIISLIPLKKLFFAEESSILFKVISIPLLVYATNMQQMCAVLFVVFLCTNIYLAVKKQFKLFYFIQLLITFAGMSLSLLLNFTGDNSRIIRETNRYFPNFAELNIFEKAELGFSSTFFCYTMETRLTFFAFLAFTIFLAVSVFKKKSKLNQKIISLYPPIFTFVCGVLSLFDNPVYDFFSDGMVNFGIGKGEYSFKVIPFIFFLLIFLSLIYTVLSLVKENSLKLYAIIAFLLGLGSRMIMGFSPTVWASGYRTFSIMLVSFVYIIFIVNKSKKV